MRLVTDTFDLMTPIPDQINRDVRFYDGLRTKVSQKALNWIVIQQNTTFTAGILYYQSIINRVMRMKVFGISMCRYSKKYHLYFTTPVILKAILR